MRFIKFLKVWSLKRKIENISFQLVSIEEASKQEWAELNLAHAYEKSRRDIRKLKNRLARLVDKPEPDNKNSKIN